MPTEADLREVLRDEPHEPGALDASRIIRRARARRLPKQLAAGIGGGLAAVALIVPVAIGLGTGTLGGAGSAADTAGGQEAAPTEADAGAAPPASASLSAAPAQQLNSCAAPLVHPAPDPSGLVLTVAPLEATADAVLEVDVTLTNTGADRVSGTTGGAPVLTLSRDGIVLWHSNGPTTMNVVPVDLEPAQSLSYTATLVPLRCDAADEGADGFRSELPELGPGDYEVSAAIDLVPLDGGRSRLVSGPAAALVLR